jgi:PKD domain
VPSRRRCRFACSLVALATTVLAFALIASSASAATYCVGSAPSCSGTAETTLEAALTKADADTIGTDTIVLPAGTFTDPTGFIYTGHVSLEIDGQGSASTILTLPTGSNDNVLTVGNGSAVAMTVSSLGIEIPAAATAGLGLESASVATTIRNVAVTAPNAIGASEGIYLPEGGSVTGTTVVLPATNTQTNVALYVAGPTTVQDSSLTGTTGLDDSAAASLVLHRVQAVGATGTGAAVFIASPAGAQIDDSILEAYTDATGLVANDATAGVTLRQVTIVGDGLSTGIDDENYTTQATPITVSDSIIANPLAQAFTIVDEGIGGVTITTDHSDYDHRALPNNVVSGPGDLPAYVAPAFADASNGDYRLLASSPATLFGADSTAKQLNESATDLDGLSRFNGSARDMGAFQHQVPTLTAATGSPAVTIGAASSFTATGGTTEPNDPLAYAWTFDDGQTAVGATASHTFATTGQHTAKVTVTDALGFTATATASVTVSPAVVATQLPSNAFTLKASSAKKTGAIAVAIHTHALGKAKLTVTFNETIKTKVGKGKHRKTKVVHRNLTYAKAVSLKVGSKDSGTIKLLPTKAAKAHLKSVGQEKVALTVTFTPTGGNSARHKLSVSV